MVLASSKKSDCNYRGIVLPEVGLCTGRKYIPKRKIEEEQKSKKKRNVRRSKLLHGWSPEGQIYFAIYLFLLIYGSPSMCFRRHRPYNGVAAVEVYGERKRGSACLSVWEDFPFFGCCEKSDCIAVREDINVKKNHWISARCVPYFLQPAMGWWWWWWWWWNIAMRPENDVA